MSKSEQTEVLRAMAHPARLRILELVSAEECCVCHLTHVLRGRQPYVSQHLMILRKAGLVEDRRDGTIVYYRVADPRIPEVLALTRDMLGGGDGERDFPAVPRSPVAGCPCPTCGGELG
jgi:ArsR family transcriptional regulator